MKAKPEASPKPKAKPKPNRPNRPPSKRRVRLQMIEKGEREAKRLKIKQAFDMRASGKNYRDIADALGVTVSTAYGYVDEYWGELKIVTDEKAEMVRQIELEKLDRVESIWLPLAVARDLDVSTTEAKEDGTVFHIDLNAYDAGLKAVDRVLKIADRRAKLLGLDKPIQIEHSGKVEYRHTTYAELQQRKAEDEAWRKAKQ